MELEKIQEIVAGILNVDPSEVTPDATFTGDLGADSLDLFQIITEAEDLFGITIEEDQLENIVTVGDALEAIRKNSGLE